MLVYVHDIIVTRNAPFAIARFKQHLSTYFHIKDSGCTMDIISETRLSRAKLGTTSIEQNHLFTKDKSSLLSRPNQYHLLISSLIYLTIT